MASITSRAYFENYSKLIPWRDILEPDGFRSEKLDKLRGSEEYVIGWTYDDGELQINLQTLKQSITTLN